MRNSQKHFLFNIQTAWIFVILLVLIVSCSNSKKDIESSNQLDSLIIINKNHNNFIELGLSDIADSIVYIPLATNKKCLISHFNSVYVSEDYIFIKNGGKSVLSFNKDGSFNCKIGKIGKGPEEYISSGSFTINDKTKRIFISAIFQNKIKVYDFLGNHIKDISFPYIIDYMYLSNNNLVILTNKKIEEPKTIYVLNLKNDKLIDSLKNASIIGINHIEKTLYASCVDTIRDIDTIFSFHNDKGFTYEFSVKQKKKNENDFFYAQIPLNIKGEKYIFGNWQRPLYSYEKSWIHITKSGRRIPYQSSGEIPRKPILFNLTNKYFCKITEIQKIKGINNDIDGGLPSWQRNMHIVRRILEIQKGKCIVSFLMPDELIKWGNSKHDLTGVKNKKAYEKLKKMTNTLNIYDNPVLVLTYLKK